MKLKSNKLQIGTEKTEYRINLRVICQAPPQPERFGAEFGLQANSTTAEWVIHVGQPLPNGDIHFGCECRVRPVTKTGAPNFLGPFVHGTPAARFLYLSWRPRHWRPGQPEPPCGTWQRRMKVHLRSITWEQIDEALKLGGVLEAIVPGTGRDGTLSCGSVTLLGRGWVVKRR